jgi:hypothetical protein
MRLLTGSYVRAFPSGPLHAALPKPFPRLRHTATPSGEFRPCRKPASGLLTGDRTQTTVWEIANNNPFGNRHREQSWGTARKSRSSACAVRSSTTADPAN